jgi:hypothetical protein
MHTTTQRMHNASCLQARTERQEEARGGTNQWFHRECEAVSLRILRARLQLECAALRLLVKGLERT